MSFDYTATGIQNTFRYEAVSFDLKTSLGDLNGIVGGTITYNYDGDLRYTATLECDGLNLNGKGLPLSCLIRIWHTAKLGNKSETRCLGTFMREAWDNHYELGHYTGTLNLYSTLLGLTSVRKGNQTVAKGTNHATRFKNVVKNAFAHPKISDSINKKKTSTKSRIWEANTSVLHECNKIADYLSAYVWVDELGYVCLVPYYTPAKRAKSFSLTTGDNTLILLGVDIDNPDWYNMVVMKASHTYTRKVNGQTKSTQYEMYASAQVGKSHKWHPNNVGRWITEDYSYPYQDDTSLTKAEFQTKMNTACKNRLNVLTHKKRTFSIEMLYRPIQVGKRGTFHYADRKGKVAIEEANVIMAEQEITLDALMTMKCTLEEV